MENSFYIFGLQIHYYGLIIATAMVIGIFLVRALAKKYDIKPDHIFDLVIIMLPLAIIGARLYYVIFSGREYTFTEIINISNGGLAIYGGVIAGLIGVIIFCKIRKYKLSNVTDILVPALILGQALGRWGNFINQEAYGYVVTNPDWQFFPFAVFIDGSGWHLATFFYESMWNFIVLAILLIVLKKSKSSGTTTALYFILYGIGRMIIEGLRTDSLYFGTVRVSQWLSGILIIIGIVILVYNYIKVKKNERKNT